MLQLLSTYSLDGGADPPHRIGSEAEALVGIETFHRLHQADIAFGDDLRDGQAIAAIAHRDLGHQAQMAGDQPACGLGIAMLLEALGEHVFVFGREKGKLTDLGQVTRQAGIIGKNGKTAAAHMYPSNPVDKT